MITHSSLTAQAKYVVSTITLFTANLRDQPWDPIYDWKLLNGHKNNKTGNAPQKYTCMKLLRIGGLGKECINTKESKTFNTDK